MLQGEVRANKAWRPRGADLVGRTLSHYRITAAIGAGGMGEVYRATDSRLGRDVALKVLPTEMASDAERMARFQREAQVLASLNHPNIAAIYGLEESNGIRALVMELVEGTTLAERIERKQLLAPSSSGGPASPHGRGAGGEGSGRAPLPLDESLHIAKQIADALEYAHEHGVIHRDLKPANVKVTPEGAVKVLDFGLAKAANETLGSGDPSSSPTFTGLGTQVGMVMGTAAYMAPEQARGYAVDRRADIWSFGVVLFEMLSGQRPFAGESTSDILASVLKFEPDWNALPGSTPPAIVRLLHRCLTKDRKQRLQAIGEARIALEGSPSGDGTAPAGFSVSSAQRLAPGELAVADRLPSVEGRRQRGRWAAIAVVAAVAVVAGAGLVALYRIMERPAPAGRMQFAIPLQSDAVNLALSADGRMLALVERDDVSGEDMLYFERLGEPGATRLEETEGASYPFWSPDDSSIGFFADGKLQKIAIAGGGPQVLATASRGRGGSWGSKGVIIYAPDAGGPLWRVNADGAGRAALTDKVYLSGESSHRWPAFLADGEHFLFWCGSFGSGPPGLKDGIYLSSLAAKEKKLVQPTEANASYMNGRLYYLDERKSLISVPSDPGDGKVTGSQQVVSDRASYEPSVSYSAFAAGGDDTVVYSAGAGAIVLSALIWCDRSGQELGRIGSPGLIANPSIAPDGNRVVVDIADLKTSNVDIWIEDLIHNAASRFTFDPTEEATPVWSRDGRMIAYRYNGVAAGIIEIKNASGLEAAREVYTTRPQDDVLPNSWTLDDKAILCTYEPAAGGSDLVLVDAASGKTTPFLSGQASKTNGMISPDGKWVAYASNESGEWQVYATTFPGAQGKWQVSPGGGAEPRWRGDGKEIFYVDPKGMLTAVTVNTDGIFTTGAGSPLFQLHGRAHISNTDLYTYDVSKDGKRFLVDRYVKPDHVEPLTVVLNASAPAQK